MTIERMKDLTNTINNLMDERRVLARTLPPVTLNEVKDDAYFEAHVREWMRVWMPTIDTTLLDRDDFEKWTLLTWRYEVREDGDGWRIYDTDESEFTDDTFEHEDEAEEACRDLNFEWQDCLSGFPFAWNTGWTLEGNHWLDELKAAGFLVYDYENAIIAGIDGGGYAFMDAHFKPLYASLAEKNGWLVETKHGPRLITTRKEDA